MRLGKGVSKDRTLRGRVRQRERRKDRQTDR